MIAIACAEGRAPRGFLSLNAACGYARAESAYLSRYAVTPLNPMWGGGRMAFLVACDQGAPRCRLMTYTNARYARATGRKLGFFSLLDGWGDSGAARALLEKAKALQKEWGSDQLLGPVPPDGGGFFSGLGEGDFHMGRGLFSGPDGARFAPVLKDSGFREADRDFAYVVPVPRENPFAPLAARARARFGFRVEPMRTGLFREEWLRRCAELCPDARRQDMTVMLARARPWVLARYSFLAMRNGECAGYLLALGARGNLVRAATLITRERAFSSPATLSLVSAFADACILGGEKWVEASVVNCENAPSARLIARLNGGVARAYVRYLADV